MSLQLTPEEFERVVIDELDELPDEMVDGLENLVFVCEDRPEDGSLDLLGIYEGVALTERDRYGFGESVHATMERRFGLLKDKSWSRSLTEVETEFAIAASAISVLLLERAAGREKRSATSAAASTSIERAAA